jgi:flagellar hook-associated protein 2
LLRGIGARCRDLVTGTAASDPDISADLDSLRKLGIVTSGADNALTINSAALDAALQNHFEDVEALIRDPDAGIVTKLDTYLSGLLNASDGTLKQRQDTINDNIGRRNATIARMERYLTQYENSLYDQFAYLQNVLNELNQQKSYLSGILGT